MSAYKYHFHVQINIRIKSKKIGWNRAYNCTPHTLSIRGLCLYLHMEVHMILNSDYRIVISEKCAESDKYAANMLSEYLRKMTSGASDIKIISDAETERDFEIIIGKTNRKSDDLPLVSQKDDSILVAALKEKLYLDGQSKRAVIYAVVELLEYLGCRFFAEDTEKIPCLEKAEIPYDLYIAKTPAFSYRDVYWTCAYPPELSVKLRLNGALRNEARFGRTLPEYLGGGIQYAGPHFVHTFCMMVPPDEYFEAHPEYFAMINGERSCKHLYTQICLSNPDVLSIVIEKTKQWCRENPDAKIVSVSQNDSFVTESYCTCEKCAAIDAEEGAPSGSLIRFVNKVAQEVEKEFPDVFVDTLAYQYSVQPPKITKPRKNVLIRLCTGGCYTHSIEECEKNTGTREAFEKWSKICDNLYVWDYTTNFLQYLTPFANMAAMRKNIKFFAEHNVRGVFMQGNYQPGKNGEFGELRSYLMAKALWDADCDMDKDAEEFIDTYYGAGAKYIKEYLKYIYEKGRLVHFTWAMPSKDMWAAVIPDSDLEYLDNLWKDAKTAAKTGESPERSFEHVERSELSHRWFKLEAGKGEFSDSDKVDKLTEEFYADCRRLGIERLSEGANIPGIQAG